MEGERKKEGKVTTLTEGGRGMVVGLIAMKVGDTFWSWNRNVPDPFTLLLSSFLPFLPFSAYVLC